MAQRLTKGRQKPCQAHKPDRKSMCNPIRQNNNSTNFPRYYCQTSSFLEKIFRELMRKLLALRGFLIFENFFLNFLIFQ